MAPSRSAVPGPLYSLDPSERASGIRQSGRLEKKRVGEWCVPGEAGPWSPVGPGVNDVHLGFSLFLLFAPVHYLRFVASFMFGDDRSGTRLASFLKQSSSGLGPPFSCRQA